MAVVSQDRVQGLLPTLSLCTLFGSIELHKKKNFQRGPKTAHLISFQTIYKITAVITGLVALIPYM